MIMIPYQIIFHHGLFWTILLLVALNIASFVVLKWICNIIFNYIEIPYVDKTSVKFSKAFENVRGYFIAGWIIGLSIWVVHGITIFLVGL